MSFAAEVQTGSDVFTGNQLRFATWAEADRYAFGLALRWTAVTNWRVVESEDLANYRMKDDTLEKLEEVPT